MEILLKYNMGYKWKKKINLNYKGVINNIQYINEEIENEESFLSILRANKQFYSIICETKEYIYAAVDHLRMYPLFYGVNGNNAYLSDSAEWIKEHLNVNKINKLTKAEFIMTGYVTGNDTLYQDVKQLQAGEYLIYNKRKKTLRTKNHYHHTPRDSNSDNKEKLINTLDEIHVKNFKRLIDFLDGRTAVLPLSAGYDSRVIAMMLKRLGYENVICYTYGKPGNWESTISEQIAHELNYKWIFIPYTKAAWKNWINSQEAKEYFALSNQYTSLPHIQDHLAIGELKRRELIPIDSVFIPGHTAILSFSGYNSEASTINHISNCLLKKHYSLWSWSHKDTKQFKNDLESRLIEQLKSISDNENSPANIFYKWELQERHAKFICNSVRAYEHYGYEWALPLWEKELLEFWMNVSNERRMGKSLYKYYYNVKINKQNTDISEPNTQGELKEIRNIKEIVKRYNRLYNKLLRLKKLGGYRTHPLGWYHIINFGEFIKGIFNGADNINSFLVNNYLECIMD